MNLNFIAEYFGIRQKKQKQFRSKMFAKFTFRFRISVDHEFEGIHIAAIEQIIFRINITNYKVGVN